jgi:hypothetical protein
MLDACADALIARIRLGRRHARRLPRGGLHPVPYGMPGMEPLGIIHVEPAALTRS